MSKLKFTIIGLLLSLATMGYSVTTNDAAASGVGYSYSDSKPAYMLENSISFVTYPMASNDVVEVFTITEPTFVAAVFYEVTTAGTLGSFDIGDGTDDDQYIAGATITNTCDWTASAASTWYVYNADETLDIVSNSAITDGVVRVRALLWPISGD